MTMTPNDSLARAAAENELIEKLRKTVTDLGEHRQTHVVWRDWLQLDSTREQINPHAGSGDFHASVILDYDRHLANINDAIDRIAALTAQEGDWVVVPREPTKEMIETLSNVGYRHGFKRAFAAMLAAAPQPPSRTAEASNAIQRPHFPSLEKLNGIE